MRCEQARAMLHAGPEGLGGLWLRLHLWRCATCRAEAEQVRVLEEALSAVPAYSPPPELLPTLLRESEGRDRRVLSRKEKRMRRFAFAVGFFVLMGLMAAGVFTKSRPPDGRSLLISAAQAMEEAKTVHLVGSDGPGTGGPNAPAQEAGGMGPSEDWYSTNGFLETASQPTGEMVFLVCGNVATGEAHGCVPQRKLEVTYHLGAEAMKRKLAADRQVYTDAMRGVTQRDTSDAKRLTMRTVVEDGRRLTVVSWPIAEDDAGAVQMSLEHSIDRRSGRLVLMRVRGPERDGSPVIRTTRIEYDVPIAKERFTYRPKPGFTHRDGYFKVLPNGQVSFGVPGDGSDPAEQQDATNAGSGGMGD